MFLTSDPKASKILMQLTWIVGGIGLWNGFNSISSGDVESATQWVSAWAVGGVGLLSFVRHAVFHRSDALRMGWDYGERNDFQLEVGFANLAWGAVAITGMYQRWDTQTLGAIVLLVGIYMLQAAVLHLLELKEAKNPRYGSKLASTAYAVCMLWFGIKSLSA